MRALLALALVAACGGAPTKLTPAIDPEQAKIEKDLAELTGLADRACACADATCAAAVDDEMAKAFREVSDEAFSDDSSAVLSGEQKHRVQTDFLRIIQCIVRHRDVPVSLGVVAIRSYDLLKRQACACQEPDCVRRSIDAWLKAGDGVGKLPVADELQPELKAIVAEATGCFTTGRALLMEEALIEARALRKTACECTTAECAEASRRESSAWAKRHARTPADARTMEQLEEIGSEIAACQLAASDDPVEQALFSMRLLRDGSCLCTQPTCADRIQEALDSGLAANMESVVGPEHVEQVRDLISEISECLVAARSAQ
jgi:hypothetical protein